MRNVFFAVVASVICACGDDKPDAPTTPPPTEGRVLVNASGIEGYEQHVFLAFVTSTGSQPTPYGVFCSWIATNDHSVSGAVVQTIVANGTNGPCEPTNTDLVLDNGDYGVWFLIFYPGEQSPKRSSNVTFTLYGDTTVNAPPFASWN